MPRGLVKVLSNVFDIDKSDESQFLFCYIAFILNKTLTRFLAVFEMTIPI